MGARLAARRRHHTRAARLLLPVAIGVSFSACSWFTDFKDQPHIYPWESTSDTVPPRGNPQLSVPVQGSAAPGIAVSYAPMPGTIDSMAGIPNPVPADARSLENGRKLYQINCSVCHGPAGMADGPVTKFGMPGIALVNESARARSDGYIFGVMRNGRGLMPSYNRLEESERWDVVNYIRGLQGGAGTAVSTAPGGRPGETGTTLPHASYNGPTRPAPYFNHIGSQAGVRATAGAQPRPPAPAGATPVSDSLAAGAAGVARDTAAAGATGAARVPAPSPAAPARPRPAPDTSRPMNTTTPGVQQ